MGYLDNSSITVDAILTKKGRELLARGDGSFNITKFALSDDEIDYNLWNASHELGSNYYGVAIENLPIVEASPNEVHVMKHKLVSLDQSVTKLPIVDLGVASIGPLQAGGTATINPSTPNQPNSNQSAGFTAIIADSSIATGAATAGGGGNGGTNGYVDTAVEGGVINQPISVIGTSFIITAKSLTSAGSTTLTIIGNESGGSKTITISVNAA